MERHYGWVIVAAGIAITCIGMGSVMALGVFLPPLEAAQGWSRTAVAGAAMMAFLAMGVAGFGWGMLTDRYGTRVVVLAGGAYVELLLRARGATAYLHDAGGGWRTIGGGS